MFKALAAIAGLLTIAIVVGLGIWAFSSLAHLVNSATDAQRKAVIAQTAAAQAQAGAAAQRVVIAGEARQHLDLTLHQETAHVIDQTAGADAPLGPALARTLYQRMCEYPSVRDEPSCRLANVAVNGTALESQDGGVVNAVVPANALK